MGRQFARADRCAAAVSRGRTSDRMKFMTILKYKSDDNPVRWTAASVAMDWGILGVDSGYA